MNSSVQTSNPIFSTGFAAVAFVLLLSVVACEKASENPQTEKSKILTNSVWKIVRVGIDSNMNNQLSQNEIDTLSTCEKDNKYDFQPAGDLVILDEGVRCGPSTIAGYAWYLRENETILEIRSYNGAISIVIPHNILSLNQDKLWLARSNGPSPNPQTIFEYER